MLDLRPPSQVHSLPPSVQITLDRLIYRVNKSNSKVLKETLKCEVDVQLEGAVNKSLIGVPNFGKQGPPSCG
jgi:hypothetical protein